MQDVTVKTEKAGIMDERELYEKDIRHTFLQTNAMIYGIRSNIAYRNYNIGPNPTSKKKLQHMPKRGTKSSKGKQINIENVAGLFVSKEAQEELRKYEVLMISPTF